MISLNEQTYNKTFHVHIFPIDLQNSKHLVCIKLHCTFTQSLLSATSYILSMRALPNMFPGTFSKLPHCNFCIHSAPILFVLKNNSNILPTFSSIQSARDPSLVLFIYFQKGFSHQNYILFVLQS